MQPTQQTVNMTFRVDFDKLRHPMFAQITHPYQKFVRIGKSDLST